MIDGFGRNINYLRLSVTDLCNLRCKYCMPEEGIKKGAHDQILSFEAMDRIVESLVDQGINKVRITGGEPLVRKDIIKLVERIGRHEGITDFSITTNGILLKEMALELKMAGVNRVNISLDTMNPVKYREMTRGGELSRVIEGMREAIHIGLSPIKLNVVLIGGFNVDEIEAFVGLTRELPIDVRFIELMPIGEVACWSAENFVKNQTVLDRVPKLQRLSDQDANSPAIYYKLPNALGRVGLISPISCKFCHECNRIRLTSEGILKYCLHSDDGLNVREVLNRGEDLEDAVSRFLLRKPLKHQIEQGCYVAHNMVQIGG